MGGQLAAFILERIRHVNRRQRAVPLPSRTAQSRHQSQLGVFGEAVGFAVQGRWGMWGA
jgi:hypothetical protein